MLVGAGGNAGNQASVRVIRGLALGTLTTPTTTSTTSTTSAAIKIVETRNRFLLRELRMAMALSLIMAIAGYIRASVFHTPLPETLAITLALIVIVFMSVCLGAILPLILQHVGIDPAHSSTTIQVVMDILGGKYIKHIYY
jgi:Mg/Co/Ni transporter MgtE